MSDMQTTKVNFLFFFLLVLYKNTSAHYISYWEELKIPICMPIRKFGVEQFVGTYMAYLHMAYIHMGRNFGPKADSAAGISPPVTSPNQEERGQQAEL